MYSRRSPPCTSSSTRSINTSELHVFWRGWADRIRTDVLVVLLKKLLLHPTDIGVLKRLENANLALKGGELGLIVAADLAAVDDFDGVVLARRLVEGLHDRRERALPKLVSKVIVRVNSTLSVGSSKDAENVAVVLRVIGLLHGRAERDFVAINNQFRVPFLDPLPVDLQSEVK
jgi:hypothetical protein